MATNGRFDLGLRVLLALAVDAGKMYTSAALAESLGTSPVMVRRAFLQLHAGGFITQRKGPNGGARLKLSPKEIGLGDVFAATAGERLMVEDKVLDAALRRAAGDAVEAMNETTLGQILKRMKKV